MNLYAVPHPEVDETLYVHECVVRVACPRCKVKNSVPCKGARFRWLETTGERRGFRYVQSAHVARHQLFKRWKSRGCPARLPAALVTFFEEENGPFPHKVNCTTLVDAMPLPKKRSKQVVQKKRWRDGGVRLRAGRSSAVTQSPRVDVRIHRGLRWENYDDSIMWAATPWAPDDLRGIYIYDHTDRPWRRDFALSFLGQNHACKTLVRAFNLAIKLLARSDLLALLEWRADWRTSELERRFGRKLNREGKTGH